MSSSARAHGKANFCACTRRKNGADLKSSNVVLGPLFDCCPVDTAPKSVPHCGKLLFFVFGFHIISF